MIAKPLTIWSERSVTENTAWMSPSSPPKSMAMNSPTTQEPLQTAPQMPKNAPASIIPSSPMFTTPARSESTPPMAANASGVAKRSIDANRPAVKMLSTVSASFDCTQIAASVPAMPIPIAHQPSRVSPRGTAAMPHAIAIMPAAIGAPTDPRLHGGSATQSATRPATIPIQAIVRVAVSRRTTSATASMRASSTLIRRPPRPASPRGADRSRGTGAPARGRR